MSVQETESIRKLFVAMDEDCDGRLSPSELQHTLDRAKISPEVSLASIVSNLDFDRSGLIDYSEFLTAAIDWKRVLSNYHIEAVFKAFDRDHSAKIELRDIQRVFAGCHVDPCDPAWVKMQGPSMESWSAVTMQEFRNLVTQDCATPGRD